MLSVCYYPEHWPRERWSEDARRMKELGLSFVRIGEFAWSRLEPEPGRYDFGWMREAMDILGEQGLQVVLGTPTATPPKWLVDAHPDILPVGLDGRRRGFGSRRHYCFSNRVYRAESRRIATALAREFGRHPALAGWQVDNEYGCHDTVTCACPECRAAFQGWLAARYGDIGALNAAWGNVFWSMELQNFGQVELPLACVTTPNPSAVLDHRRFASDTVIEYNRAQVSELRAESPGRFVTTNFMGGFTQFDHFKLMQDLDFATWDSYPLGFLDESGLPDDVKVFYARSGHPDIAALNHDLYRAVGRGKFWVMEQQPGPVNWAGFNPSPAPGMVRYWTLEALAHGADEVSYFRFRQAPFAQEQMHAGLHTPDGGPDVASSEIEAMWPELRALDLEPTGQAEVAIVFDYEAAWVFEAEPQGKSFRYPDLVLTWYSAARALGLNVDFVRPGDNLDGYKLVLVPSLPIVSAEALSALQSTGAVTVFGPRCGSKTSTFQIPGNLPPGPLQALLPLQVTRVESLRPGLTAPLEAFGQVWPVGVWREYSRSELEPVQRFQDGVPALYRHGPRLALMFWPDGPYLGRLLAELAGEVGLATTPLQEGLRLRHRGALTFAFNAAPYAQAAPAGREARFVVGGSEVPAYGVSVWRDD